MTKRSFILLIALIGITASAFSSEEIKIIKEEDLTLQNIVNRVSYVTGDKYYTSENLDVKVSIVNLDIDKKNADAIVSSLLHQNNLIRVKESGKLFKIISTNDLRYSVVPSIAASKRLDPNFPRTHDYYLLKYTISGEQKIGELRKVIGPHLSAHGQVISANNAGEILVKDNANNLAKIYSVLKKSEIDSEDNSYFTNEREREYHLLENNGPKES